MALVSSPLGSTLGTAGSTVDNLLDLGGTTPTGSSTITGLLGTTLGSVGSSVDNVLGLGGTTTTVSTNTVATLLGLDLGSLANITLGTGGTGSLLSIDGSVGTTTATSPIINLGIDLGTGSTGGVGGLLTGLLGGGTSGVSLIPATIDTLLGTVTDLTTLLTGGGGTTPGGTNLGGTNTIPTNPGTPGQTITGTEGWDTLHGTSGNDVIKALGGNDVIFGHGGNDVIDGGAGVDTFVATGALSVYNAASQNGVLALQNKMNGEIDYLANVERIYFSDNKVLALDFNGNAGEAFRLYQAALDRAPEAAGLRYHVTLLDQGMSLHDDAQSFISSPEFSQKYGSNLSDQQFVTALYSNTLHRGPDATGFNYWTNQLAMHSQDRASVLVGFSESPENHAQTDHQLRNGILLDYSVA